MSVANLNAYALSQGITKTYDSMNQAEQTTLRYNYLMSVSKDAQGDFAKTSDSFANQMRVASLNVKSLFADIGQLLIPVAQNAMKSFNDVANKLREAFKSDEMKANIQAIAENVGKLVTKIAELIGNNLPKMIEGLSWIMNNANTIAAGIVAIGSALTVMKSAALIMTLVEAFNKAKKAEEGLTVTTWLLKAATTALGGPWGIIAGVIAGVVAVIIYLWNTNEGFRDAIIGAWSKIKEVASNVWNGVIEVFKAVVGWIKSNWQGLALFIVNPFVGGFKLLYDNCGAFRDFINNFVQGVKQLFSNMWEGIKSGWNGVGTFFTSTLPQAFISLWDKIKNAFSAGWNSIKTFITVTIPAGFNAFISFLATLPNKILFGISFIVGYIMKSAVNAFNYLVTNIPIWLSNIKQFFINLPGKIWNFLTDIVSKVIQWGQSIFTNVVSFITNTTIAMIQQIASWPGQIWNFLVNIVTSIATWGSDIYNTAVNAISNMINAVIQWFSSLPGAIWNWLTNVVSGVSSWGSDMYSTASDAISNVVNGIIDWFSELPSKMLDIGANIVNGIKEGISNAWHGLTGWIGSLCNSLTGGFAKGWDINSPSRVMRDFIGKNLVAGIQVGVDYEFPNLQKSVQGNIKDFSKQMKATVGYETAKTTASVVAQNNVTIQQANENFDNKTSNQRPILLENTFDVDGRRFVQEVVAPHQKVLDEYWEGRTV